ncbi:MAG: hypothetical protein ACKPKO_37895 [Candidatus Fonsibacter sp.]
MDAKWLIVSPAGEDELLGLGTLQSPQEGRQAKLGPQQLPGSEQYHKGQPEKHTLDISDKTLITGTDRRKALKGSGKSYIICKKNDQSTLKNYFDDCGETRVH